LCGEQGFGVAFEDGFFHAARAFDSRDYADALNRIFFEKPLHPAVRIDFFRRGADYGEKTAVCSVGDSGWKCDSTNAALRKLAFENAKRSIGRKNVIQENAVIEESEGELLHLFDQNVQGIITCAHGAVSSAVLHRKHGGQAVHRLKEAAEFEAFHFELVFIHGACPVKAIVT
jgi:hypothetical protein